MAGTLVPRAVWWGDGPGQPQALQGVDVPRFAVRRRVLRRRHVDGYLLPADLPGEDAEGGQLPLLRHAAGGRAGGLSALPALPPGTGAGQRAGGRCAANRPADRATARGRAPRREGGARGDRRPVRAELAPDSPHRPQGAGRAADSAAAHAPVVAGQAAADRNDAADHRGRLRQRLLEPAPVQRRVQPALWHAADAAPQEGDRRRGADHREPDVDPAALVSPAVRLDGHPRVSRRPCAQGRRAGDGQLVRPDRASGRGDGLDPGDAGEENSTRWWSSSRTA